MLYQGAVCPLLHIPHDHTPNCWIVVTSKMSRCLARLYGESLQIHHFHSSAGASHTVIQHGIAHWITTIKKGPNVTSKGNAHGSGTTAKVVLVLRYMPMMSVVSVLIPSCRIPCSRCSPFEKVKHRRVSPKPLQT